MRLKTKSAMLSEAMSISSVTSLLMPPPPRPAICPSATSPATRPTPTTEIGPLGSRSPEPKAACATPTIFCGMRRMTPAVWPTCVPMMPGTAVIGCLTSADRAERTPMKPTRSVRTLPGGVAHGLALVGADDRHVGEERGRGHGRAGRRRAR